MALAKMGEFATKMANMSAQRVDKYEAKIGEDRKHRTSRTRKGFFGTLYAPVGGRRFRKAEANAKDRLSEWKGRLSGAQLTSRQCGQRCGLAGHAAGRTMRAPPAWRE